MKKSKVKAKAIYTRGNGPSISLAKESEKAYYPERLLQDYASFRKVF